MNNHMYMSDSFVTEVVLTSVNVRVLPDRAVLSLLLNKSIHQKFLYLSTSTVQYKKTHVLLLCSL